MTEERITTTKAPDGTPTATSHTTIIREGEPRRSSGGAGWLIAVVLIIAVIAGIYILSQGSASEAAKDNAIAGAANEVGEAAGKIGDAAGQAGEAVENAADKVGN